MVITKNGAQNFLGDSESADNKNIKLVLIYFWIPQNFSLQNLKPLGTGDEEKETKRSPKKLLAVFFLPSELHKSATLIVSLQLQIFSSACILIINFIIKLPHKQLSLEDLSCKGYFVGQNKTLVKWLWPSLIP